jgi:hypothetical protein
MQWAKRGLWDRAGIVFVLVGVSFLAPRGFFAPSAALSQSGSQSPKAPADPLPDIVPNHVASATPNGTKDRHAPLRLLDDHIPDKPTVAPSFRIPIDTLGFTVPGPFYFGKRFSMASLDFLSDDHLLLTFRVPGLIHRESGRDSGEYERQIRALVLNAKTGQTEAEALWTVHDYARYLWMLKDGHFLLRDRDQLEQGDSSLVLKPALQFPGPLNWLELDPQQQYIVTNSREPADVEAKPGQVGSPPTAATSIVADGQNASDPANTVVRILERSTGKVMMVSRVRSTIHLPINADGYLERLKGNGQMWLLNLKFFSGGSRMLGRIESVCSPYFDFVSQSEFLVTACGDWGGKRLSAFTIDGRRLWDDDTTSSAFWPINVMSPDGSRLALETLQVIRPMSTYAPIDTDDVRVQLVRILNAADGTVALEAIASPALDSGGNVAISSTGRKVALLSDGAIQVFELPAAPPLPASAAVPAAR